MLARRSGSPLPHCPTAALPRSLRRHRPADFARPVAGGGGLAGRAEGDAVAVGHPASAATGGVAEDLGGVAAVQADPGASLPLPLVGLGALQLQENALPLRAKDVVAHPAVA